MDYCSQPGLLPLAAALGQMHALITPVSEQKLLPLLEVVDRVIAEDILSSISVPGYDNAAMDGYALRFADIAPHKSLRIVGQSLAGSAFTGTVGNGECVRIMTGAVIPEGADTVVIQENTLRVSDSPNLDRVELLTPPKPYENIRRMGEDIAQGALVFRQGHRLAPVDIGLLASLGIAAVKVYRKLRIAILSTGDELSPPGQCLGPGQIYDSNRYALMALLQRLNVHCIDLGLVPDQLEALRKAFAKGGEEADAIICSGGVSVGDADYTKEVVAQIGTINFWKIAIKPGKPFAFGNLSKLDSLKTASQNTAGTANKTANIHPLFFGLPGNPVSAVVTYHQLVVPALRYLAGETLPFSSLPDLTVTASNSIRKQVGRSDFQRGIVSSENGIDSVAITGNQSSGVLTSITQANCYIVLAEESGPVAKGEPVQVRMFDHFIR